MVTLPARSALGSTYGGAAERSEAEGVYPIEWYKLVILPRPCRGRQPGDPPLPEQLGTLHGSSCRYLPLASPGGKLDFLLTGASEPVDKKD